MKLAITFAARHTPHFRHLLLGTACCVTLAFGWSHAAAAETLVTGPSPFANCTADDVAGQIAAVEGRQVYQDAEVEPWIAVNPEKRRNLVAGWQQDRWSDGGARGLAAGYSFDGGRSWATSVPPGITLCSGGIYQRASDPWVTIGKNGTAYFMSLAFQNDENCADGSTASGDNAMLVNISKDGGRSWGPPATLVLDTDGQKFNDKNSMLADPYDKNFVYAVWDKLLDFTFVSECPAVAQAKTNIIKASTGTAKKAKPNTGRSQDGVMGARDRMNKLRSEARKGRSLLAKRKKEKDKNVPPDGPSPVPTATPENSEFSGPTYFVRSVDGGKSWRPERLIFDPGPDAQTINNLVEVTKNRTVFVFFTHIFADGTVKLGYVNSNDKGGTFSPVAYAADMNITATGTLTPNAQAPVRDANILFDSAVDPKNGNLYLVWQDGSEGDIDRVAFTMSTNNGNSWSVPVIINATPTSADPLRNQAFIPSVEVGKDGKVHVTYYDFRNDADNGKELTDFWAISCNIKRGADCRTKSGWSNETRLTSASFDMLDAPIARGHFLGDYMGLARAGNTVKAIFGKAVADNVNDMFMVDLPR